MTYASLIAAVALALHLVPAIAQTDFPSQPVKIIVPFTAGGITDSVARTVGRKLAEVIGQPVVIENKAGAGGTVGTELAAAAEPNGYTLFLGSQGTQAINPALYKQMRINPVKELTGLQSIVGVPAIVVVNEKMPFRNLRELIDYGRANPGKLNVASPGSGSGSHLAAELFQAETGAKFTHVPYRGSAPAMADLLGGQVDLSFDYMPTAGPHIKAGRLRALAVSGAQRLPVLPDVQTVGELGFPTAESTSWIGIFAPSRTPAPIRRKLEAALAKAANDPEVKQAMIGFGGFPFLKTGDAFQSFVESDGSKWRAVVVRSGATAE